MLLGPGFFNEFTEGFDVKLIASINQSHPGWNDNSWIMVRSDVWDSGKIRTLADLRGKAVDGFFPGGPPNMLVKSALVGAGLGPSDLAYSEKLKTSADVTAAFHNQAVDLSGFFEPFASVLEQQHLAHKWLSYQDVIPWFQEMFLAASGAFFKDHPDGVRRFLIAYLEGARDVSRTNGRWTPELVSELAKWSEVPSAIITQIPTPAYVGQMGAISIDSIERQEQFYMGEHLVTKHVDPASIVDGAPLRAAREAVR
jgi:NitT/TauT family transport system substrate-binding protein